MEFLRTKDQLVNSKLGSIHESVFKMGDTYKVKTSIDIPKSLINAFVSKAKKENDLDPRENWSDVDLAEMFVNYIFANFMTIESLPVAELLGEKSTEVQTTVQPDGVTNLTPENTPPAQVIPPAQSQTIPAAQGGVPSAEIQNPIV